MHIYGIKRSSLPSVSPRWRHRASSTRDALKVFHAPAKRAKYPEYPTESPSVGSEQGRRRTRSVPAAHVRVLWEQAGQLETVLTMLFASLPPSPPPPDASRPDNSAWGGICKGRGNQVDSIMTSEFYLWVRTLFWFTISSAGGYAEALLPVSVTFSSSHQGK